MHDSLKVIGWLNIQLLDQFGNIKQEFDTDNLIVFAGKKLIARRLAGLNTGISVVPSHMAIGTNNTNPNSSDLTLNTEIARVALTSTNVNDNIVTYSASFGPNVPNSVVDIKEAGILNASSSGELLNRTIFPSVTKQLVDTLVINWNIKIQ